MKNLLAIVLITLVTSCTMDKEDTVKPRPFSYQDCINYVKNKEFCLSNATK